MGSDFRLFEDLERDVHSVFRDKGLLSVSYVPGDVVGRGREERYLAGVLTRGVAEWFLPSMIRVYGRPGSGKTAVVRSVLGRFASYRGDVFRFFYVNLKRCRTVFSAGNAVLSAICGDRVPVNLGLDRVFLEIWSEFEELYDEGVGFVCLVLDEIDSIFLDKHYDPSDFIYRFLRYNEFRDGDEVQLCLIVITNNPIILEDNLDARVKSSMGGEMMIFSPYSRDELAGILKARVAGAFVEDGVEEAAVEFCAELVSERSGDARRAIDLLRVSGEIANERKSRVDVDCVESALDRVERDWVFEELSELPLNYAIVLGVIAILSRDKETIQTRDLYQTYRRATVVGSSGGIELLSDRRILDIVKELETIGFLSAWNVSRGRYGYQKEIRLNIDPGRVLEYYESRKEHFGFYFEVE